MCSYYLVSEKGQEKFGESIYNILLLCSIPNVDGLYKVPELQYLDEIPEGFVELPMETIGLIASAEKFYAPAICLTQLELYEKLTNLKDVTNELFIEEYTKTIKKHLDRQKYSNYILAQASDTNLDSTDKNYYYWLLSYDPETEYLGFVDWFYMIKFFRPSNFNIDKDLLKRLPTKIEIDY